MTDVNCFTSEHTTTTAPTTVAAEATTLTTPTKNVAPSASPTSPFVLRAPPSAKSKLILQNMEEVLNSVKQKHREKHKRKREEKRRAAMLAEQAGAAGTLEPKDAATKTKASSGSSNNSSSTNTSNGRHVLREKTANGKRKSATSPLKCSTPNATAGEDQQTSIKKHFAKTDSKTGTTTTKTDTAEKVTKPATNVFELMMSARNRSIGSNANGSLHSPEEEAVPQGSTPRTKRKQLLQEWNERKGGTKRRQADDARGEYIEQQMEQRAKR